MYLSTNHKPTNIVTDSLISELTPPHPHRQTQQNTAAEQCLNPPSPELTSFQHHVVVMGVRRLHHGER